MKSKNPKRLIYSLVSAIIVFMLLVPLTRAEGIVLDGVIDELGYTLYIRDDTHGPIYSLYTATDDNSLYLGIVLEDDADASNDLLLFAYRQQNTDYWIRVKDALYKFRPRGGIWQGWWQGVRPGLPEGVDIVVGETNEETSYEIQIARNVLGDYGDDLPDSFQFWLELKGDVNSVDHNWYPENNWWFYTEEHPTPSFNGDEQEAPRFHVPEVPYGTILTLATMAAALAIVLKKPIFK